MRSFSVIVFSFILVVSSSFSAANAVSRDADSSILTGIGLASHDDLRLDVPNRSVESHVEKIEGDDKNQNGLQFVLYSFAAGNDIGYCSGISLNSTQFLSTRHCTDKIRDLASISVVGLQDAKVADLSPIPNYDSVVVTLNKSSFNNVCATFSDTLPSIAEHLELYALNVDKKSVLAEDLVVESNSYSAFNPDLGQRSDGLIRARALDGSPTVDGDSGAPVFRHASNGQRELVGIVVGVSRNTKDVIVQPVSKISHSIESRMVSCGVTSPNLSTALSESGQGVTL